MSYSFTVGSFNLYKFSYRSDDTIRKDISRIAAIINENFDVVALQEVFSAGAMNLLLKELGGNWGGKWASPRPSVDANKDSLVKPMSAQAAEGYAFLWKKRRFELFTRQEVYGTRTVEPDIYTAYKVDEENRLLRDPLWIRLVPKRGPFCEIRLFNTHIRFSKDGSSEDDTEGETILDNDIKSSTESMSASEARKQELDVLIKRILQYNMGGDAGNRQVYCFLLGDYNLNIKNNINAGPYLPEVVEIKDGAIIQHFVTVQDEKTTLKQEKNIDETTVDRYANNYDHFTYNKTRLVDNLGIRIESFRVDTLGQEWCNGQDVAKHRKEVSDHVPVGMNVTIG